MTTQSLDWRSLKDWLPLVQAQIQLLRRKVISSVIAVTPPLEAGFIVAVLFGSTELLSERLEPMFKTTGTLHLLAASGLNVSIVRHLLESVLPLSLPTRLKGSLLLMGITVYMLLVGLQPSIVRASAMASQSVMARYWFFRQYRSLYGLMLSCLVMLVIRPDWLHAIGFQLSVLATAGIIVITPLLLRLTGLKNLDRNRDSLFVSSNNETTIRQKLLEPFMLSIAAQSVTMPLVLYHFGFSPLISFIPAAILGSIIPWLLSSTVLAVVGLWSLELLAVPLAAKDAVSVVMLWLPANFIVELLEWLAQYHWLQLEVTWQTK